MYISSDHFIGLSEHCIRLGGGRQCYDNAMIQELDNSKALLSIIHLNLKLLKKNLEKQ